MMNVRTASICCLAALAGALLLTGPACRRTAGTSSDLEAADVLLKDDDIIGLKKNGASRTASDLNSLYDIIDGGAQKYIDNGFEEALFQTYQYEASTYVIEVYDQSGAAYARTIYDEFYPPGAEVFFSGAGREAVINHSLVGSYSLQLYQERFFVRINTAEKTDPALNMAKLICSNISGKIE